MKLSEIITLESRKNPEQNPKYTTIEQLQKYKNDPNVYISFTEINKLGIFPSSIYSTPTAIYAYPLKLSWKYYDVDRHGLHAFPFAKHQPYIQVFKYTGHKKLVNDFSNYTAEDFANDIATIKQKFPEYTDAEIKSIMRKSTDASPFGKFWQLTRILSKDAKKWRTLLSVLGYDGFIDNGSKIVYPSEPVQALFLSMDCITPIETIISRNDLNYTARTDMYHSVLDNIPSDYKKYIDPEYAEWVNSSMHEKFNLNAPEFDFNALITLSLKGQKKINTINVSDNNMSKIVEWLHIHIYKKITHEVLSEILPKLYPEHKMQKLLNGRLFSFEHGNFSIISNGRNSEMKIGLRDLSASIAKWHKASTFELNLPAPGPDAIRKHIARILNITDRLIKSPNFKMD